MSQFSSGRQVGLIAPGETARPASTPAVSEAYRYLSGLADQGMQTIGSLKAREEAAEEEAAREHEVLIRGETAITAERERPSFAERIETGDIEVAPTPEGNATIAQQLIAERTADMNEIQRDEYRRLNEVWLTNSLESKRRQIAEDELAKLDADTLGSLANVTDTDVIQKTFNYRRDMLKLSDARNYSGLVRAMRVSAAEGNGDAVEAMAKFLPPEYGVEVAEARSVIDQFEDERLSLAERSRLQASASDIEQLRGGQMVYAEAVERAERRYADDAVKRVAAVDRLKEIRDEMQRDNEMAERQRRVDRENESTELFYQMIRLERNKDDIVNTVVDHINKGWVSEETASSFLNSLESEMEKEEQLRIREAAIRQSHEIKADHVRRLAGAIKNNIGSAIRDADWEIEGTIEDGTVDGMSVRMSAEDAKRMAVETAFAQIDAESGDNASAAFARKVRALANSNLTYDQWSNIMEAGYNVPLDQMFNADGEALGDSDSVPPAAIEGFNIYRSLRQHGRPITNRHLGSDTAGYYDMALAAFTSGGTRGDVERSLILAKHITEDPAFAARRKSQIDEREIKQQIDSASSRLFGRDFGGNSNDVATAAYTKAQFYAMLGMNAREATQRAIDEYTSSENGVNVRNFRIMYEQTSLPETDIEPGVNALIEHITEGDGGASRRDTMRDLGINPSGLMAIPLTQDTWQIVDEDGMPVRFTGMNTIWTNDEIMEILQAKRQRQDTARGRAVAASSGILRDAISAMSGGIPRLIGQ